LCKQEYYQNDFEDKKWHQNVQKYCFQFSFVPVTSIDLYNYLTLQKEIMQALETYNNLYPKRQ
jgi:hypothetical protein